MRSKQRWFKYTHHLCKHNFIVRFSSRHLKMTLYPSIFAQRWNSGTRKTTDEDYHTTVKSISRFENDLDLKKNECVCGTRVDKELCDFIVSKNLFFFSFLKQTKTNRETLLTRKSDSLSLSLSLPLTHTHARARENWDETQTHNIQISFEFAGLTFNFFQALLFVNQLLHQVRNGHFLLNLAEVRAVGVPWNSINRIITQAVVQNWTRRTRWFNEFLLITVSVHGSHTHTKQINK